MAHRPRPMQRWRRTLLLAALLLLAGAVVNVAVAWALIGWPRWGDRESVELLESEEARDQARCVVAWPEATPPPTLLITYYMSGRQMNVAYSEYYDAYRVRVGWPMHSMQFDGRRPCVPAKWIQVSASLPAPSVLRRNGWFGHTHDHLPLTPLFPGFLLNTLFYAAILALPLSFFPLRRRLRARRGRCPKCNYDLAGLAGPCPECGFGRMKDEG